MISKRSFFVQNRQHGLERKILRSSNRNFLWYNGYIMKPIIFPRDEQAHDKIIEWWYWNGHLIGEDGNRYAFMDCLFQTKPRQAKLPFFKMPFKKAYFSHSILSDIKKQKFYPTVDFISLVSAGSFKRPLFFAEYIDTDFLNGFTVSAMEETAPFQYRLRAKNFDLTLTAVKKPLLEGDRGYLNMGERNRNTNARAVIF